MRTARFAIACVALIFATAGQLQAGMITTGARIWDPGVIDSANLIVQGFNLDDGASETFLDSFDFGVNMYSSDTLYGVFLEIQAGTAQVIARTNVGSVALNSGLQLASFNVNQLLDVTKTYAVGVYSQNNYHGWQAANKSADPQWVNHTYYYPAPSVGPGFSPYYGSGHDWNFDSVTTLHLSSAPTVPEPTSLTLWSLGLVGMTFVRLRTRQALS